MGSNEFIFIFSVKTLHELKKIWKLDLKQTFSSILKFYLIDDME